MRSAQLLALLFASVRQAPVLSTSPYAALSSRETAVTLTGRTPCCVDRLTALTCQRLAQKHPARFAVQCMHSADFAFVQCCASCFNPRFANSSGMYSDAVRRLIHQPAHGDCRDVRGAEWCGRFAKRDAEALLPERGSQRSFWEPWFRQGCESFPFAFRVCRASCGFCSTGLKRATVAFSHRISLDSERCPPTKAFSLRKDEIAPDFDPLSSLDIKMLRRATGDYFVVLEHDYVVDVGDEEEEEEDIERWSETRNDF